MTPTLPDSFPRHPCPAVVLEPQPTRHEPTETELAQLAARLWGRPEHAPEDRKEIAS